MSSCSRLEKPNHTLMVLSKHWPCIALDSKVRATHRRTGQIQYIPQPVAVLKQTWILCCSQDWKVRSYLSTRCLTADIVAAHRSLTRQNAGSGSYQIQMSWWVHVLTVICSYLIQVLVILSLALGLFWNAYPWSLIGEFFWLPFLFLFLWCSKTVAAKLWSQLFGSSEGGV